MPSYDGFTLFLTTIKCSIAKAQNCAKNKIVQSTNLRKAQTCAKHKIVQSVRAIPEHLLCADWSSFYCVILKDCAIQVD